MTSAELIAGLVRKHRAGTPLWITHPRGGDRVIAEILPTDRGFVFADIGWNTNDSGHPFHDVEGIASGRGSVLIELVEGGWAEVFEFGDYVPPAVARDLARWREYLASPEAKRYGGAKRMLELVKDGLAPDARLD